MSAKAIYTENLTLPFEVERPHLKPLARWPYRPVSPLRPELSTGTDNVPVIVIDILPLHTGQRRAHMPKLAARGFRLFSA